MATAAGTGGVGEKVTGVIAEQLKELAKLATGRLASAATGRIGDVTQRLTEYAAEGGKTALKEAIGLGGKSGKSGGKKVKVVNIVETADVGVPVRVAYNQWTQFRDFPSFMKKVENVDQQSDEKLTFKAKIFWSHRTWEATVVEQVPDERIIWRSKGVKGSVDGAVSFHELAPNLTRIVLVLEYHPQGLFERTGNIWRAQGRRARLELKHFVRHVMTQSARNPDEVDGWRGEIRDGQVVRDHESAVAEEEGENGSTEQPSAEQPTSRRRTGSARSKREDKREEQTPRRRPARRGAGQEPARRPGTKRTSNTSKEG